MSVPAVAITPYFALNLIVEIKCSWPSTFFFYLPKCRSHIRIVLSSEAEYKYFPVGCKAKLRTQLSCPIKVYKSYPAGLVHNLINLSRAPEIIKVWWYFSMPLTPFYSSYFKAVSLFYCVNLCFKKSEFIRTLLFSP